MKALNALHQVKVVVETLKIFKIGACLGVVLCVHSVSAQADCDARPSVEQFYQTGWGIDDKSQRFQTHTSIGVDNAHKLELKWAYGFGNKTPRVFPLVSEDTIFVGDGNVGVVALDRNTGCTRWINESIQDAATAIAHGVVDGKTVLVLAGRRSGIFALDAASGETLWRKKLDSDNPVPMYSGSPLVFENQVFVPLSSMEIGLSVNPFYGCCTTSGAMAALDLETGETNWYKRTIPQQPKVTGKHYLFVNEFGPSGAPVWNAPTLDAKRRLLYFGTGQNYSHPTTETSDAVIALDIDSGETRWVTQFTEGDAFNMACGRGGINCPNPTGPDIDIGAPPILATLEDGQELVLAGQKSGDVWALNPESGEIEWHTRIGRGDRRPWSAFGGWAADRRIWVWIVPRKTWQCFVGV